MSVNHFELDLIKYVLVSLRNRVRKGMEVMEDDTYYLWHFFSLFFFYNEDVTIFLRVPFVTIYFFRSYSQW